MSPRTPPGDPRPGDPVTPQGAAVTETPVDPPGGRARVPGPPARGSPPPPVGQSDAPATADHPASYEDAARQAFLSPEFIEPAPIARRRAPGTMSTSPATTAIPNVAPDARSTPAAPASSAYLVDGNPLGLTAPAAGAPMTAAAEPVAWVAVGPGAGTTPPDVSVLPAAAPEGAAPPTPPPTRAPALAAPPAGTPPSRGAERPRPEAGDDLLHVPESVSSTAEDFFGGLVRRVERRR